MTQSTPTTFEKGFEPDSLLRQGYLWVAPVWNYTEGKNSPRPIVIVGNEHANDKVGVIINFITKSSPRDDFDVEIVNWKEAGLKVPSYVRTGKPTTILKAEINQAPTTRDGIVVPRGFIGKMHDDDLQKVLKMCKNIF